MKLGVHASKAGGLQNAPPRAADFGAECFQVFTKSQRRWSASPIEADEVDAYHEALDEQGYAEDEVFVHGAYLINLASEDDEQVDKSVDALVDELERASTIDALGVCFHPGSHKGAGEEYGVERVTEAIGRVLDRAPDDVLLLIENMPGAGTQVGADPEHLGTWMDAFPADRVGLTLDTCHLFVAGYDLRPDAYEDTVATLEAHVDLDRVASWHLNDARNPFESNKDGHAPVGEGHLGVEGFEPLLDDERWAGVPASLETTPDTYEADLKRLREVRTVDA
jgi:deoxyribonuclease-4